MFPKQRENEDPQDAASTPATPKGDRWSCDGMRCSLSRFNQKKT